MESGLYEAYGPGGVGIVVETLSDNKNRTVGEVQSAMKKSGATPAQQGSVLFNLSKRPLLLSQALLLSLRAASEAISTEDFDLKLIDAGADDIDRSEEGIVITGQKEAFQKLVESVEAAGLKPDEAGLEYIPKVSIKADSETRAKIEKNRRSA